MNSYGVVSVSFVFVSLAACASVDNVRFSVKADQTAIVRDGRPALVSKKKSSVVLVGPAGRGVESGARPIFVVSATNLTRTPISLAVSDITVSQITTTGSTVPLPVIPYEQLVSEERTRQVVGAILVGVSATANAYSASRAGYGSANSTVRGPYGTSYITTNYYSPTAAVIAQTNASFENQAMIGQHIESGRANMANIEREVLKDNTIMPGEWVGGQVHLTPPVGDTDQPKNYQISLRVGSDLHIIDVIQELQR